MNQTTISALLEPLATAVMDPVILLTLACVLLLLLARWLQHNKNAKVAQVGSLIEEGVGLVYRYMVVNAVSKGAGALTTTALVEMERNAISTGVAQLKQIAGAQNITLPDDTTLKLKLAAGLGKAYQADSTVSPLGNSAVTAIAPPNGAAVASASA